MITLLCNQRKDRRFHVIADGAYGTQKLLPRLPEHCDLTSSLHMDARLYEAPPPPTGRRGRPRKRGRQLPTPEQMLAQGRRRLKMNLYGRKQNVEVAQTVAYLHQTPQRPVCVVAVEPLQAGCRRRAFYSTCHQATAKQVLTWYAQRWSLEVTFHDVKQHLGFEDPPGWTRRAVERTAPMALLLYDFIVLWYVEYAAHRNALHSLPWYPAKSQPSFSDMLLALRRESIAETIFATAAEPLPASKIKNLLEFMLQIAA